MLRVSVVEVSARPVRAAGAVRRGPVPPGVPGVPVGGVWALPGRAGGAVRWVPVVGSVLLTRVLRLPAL